MTSEQALTVASNDLPDGARAADVEARPGRGGAGSPTSIVVVRHGATEWSRNGRHTSRTDLPLDEGGREEALAIGVRLRRRRFAQVLTSPRRRARETCELAGFGARAEVLEDLAEWAYGDYEGLTTAEIRERQAGWSVFRDGCPGGESPQEVGARADRVLERLALRPDGDPGEAVLLFSHGHFLRVLAARWLRLSPGAGRHLALDAGRLSEIGFERDTPALLTWNS